MEMRLPLPEASLILDTTEGWCRVWLESGDGRRHLGSDTPAIIRGRLLAHLSAPREPPSGVVDGRPAYWVLSLYEQHHTMYVQFDPDGRRLLIQDGNAVWVWQGLLPEPEWQEWQRILANPATEGIR